MIHPAGGELSLEKDREDEVIIIWESLGTYGGESRY